MGASSIYCYSCSFMIMNTAINLSDRLLISHSLINCYQFVFASPAMMSIKLAELKKKMLEQQQSKTQSAPQLQSQAQKSPAKSGQPIQAGSEEKVPEIQVGKEAVEGQQSIKVVLTEDKNGVNSEQSVEEGQQSESSVEEIQQQVHDQNANHQLEEDSSEQEERQPQQKSQNEQNEIVNNPQAHLPSNQQIAVQAPQEELPQGNQPQNQVAQPIEEGNLQLHDKNPVASCSVDEEIKAVQVVEAEQMGQVLMPESKVQKKQRKIMLKQLEMIHRCVKNLKQSVKGLQILQKKVEVNPNIKQHIQFYLKELRVLQGQY